MFRMKWPFYRPSPFSYRRSTPMILTIAAILSFSIYLCQIQLQHYLELKQIESYRHKIDILNLTAEDIEMCLKIDLQVTNFPNTIQRKHYVFGRGQADDTAGHIVASKSSILNDHEKSADIALVTQLSCNRINAMLALMDHWGGPMSVAVYCQEQTKVDEFLQLVKIRSMEYKSHILLNVIYNPTNMDSLYPINYLRNIALQSAVTEYVFLCDADFVPSFGLYRQSVKAATSLLHKNVVENRTIVVAAFEEKIKMQSFPKNKLELQRLYNEKVITQFHNKTFNRGHGPTDYTRWFTAQSPYNVNWRKDYEPYIIVKRKTVPLYDESFIGYGFNKIVHIAELHAMKYKFIVLPNEFIIHRIHPATIDKQLIDERGHVRNCIKKKYLMFMWEYLPSKYGLGWEKKLH